MARRTHGVETAVELYALAEQLLRQRLRRERPHASRAAVESEIQRWRIARPGAERGDASGRVVRWPRRLHR